MRVGSSAGELPHALVEGSAPGWPEDRVSLPALETHAVGDPLRDCAYFRVKLSLARAAEEAGKRGIDVVTALPTYVLSWWGDRGREEPLEQAYRVAKRTGLVPSVPLNVVPADVAATGILLVGLVFGVVGRRRDTRRFPALVGKLLNGGVLLTFVLVVVAFFAQYYQII